MSYIDGFVIAVPKENKQKFIEHAKRADSVFIEHGAITIPIVLNEPLAIDAPTLSTW